MPEPMSLDILLLNVHRRYLNYVPRHGGFLGIYILAAFLRKMGYNAKSFSGTLRDGKEELDRLCTARKTAMVGLYVDYENVSENVFLSRHVKEKYALPVVVGGPQSTALDKMFCECSGCDVIVRYEGELTLLELLDYFLEGMGNLAEILGIAYLDAGTFRVNKERPLIANLDSLPFIDEACYLRPKDFQRGLSVMTGRGCPFQCAFCHEGTHARQVRLRSVGNVLAEIDAYFARTMQETPYILFTDDTLTLEPERLHELCLGLANRQAKRKFKWFCEAHVNTLYRHPEMIEDLAMAGCTRIQLGIEAGTEPVLKAYGKHTTPEEIFFVVEKCRDAGIPQIYGNIILVGANFSREVYAADKAFVEGLIKMSQGTVEIGVVTFWPLPETPMTRRPEKYGLTIRDYDFVTSAGDFPQAETPGLDRFAVAQMQKELETAIEQQMTEMLENWDVPTPRVLSWFAKSRYREGYGGWFLTLSRNEVLYSYYEMLYLEEGRESSQVADITEAHPMRVAPLYKHLATNEDGSIEIRGARFSKEEREIAILTAGKLSVAEIARRTGQEIAVVLAVLKRLEEKHFIVYSI